jgi:hypothetical protein
MVGDASSSDRITNEKNLGKLTRPTETTTLGAVKAETALSNARVSLYAAQHAERLAKAELEE